MRKCAEGWQQSEKRSSFALKKQRPEIRGVVLGACCRGFDTPWEAGLFITADL